jgi:hypothetical protein
MAKICYVPKRFTAKRMAVIEKANEIIEAYQAQGYRLTLRQLYYQFVARDLIPNKQNEYDNLGNVINDARLAGLVDWNAIEDRTRNMQRLSHWDDPADIMHGAANSYHTDWWKNQDHYVEVWVEKEALAGVIQRPSEIMDVPWLCCRGYMSQSEMWSAAMRMQQKMRAGKQCVVLHLGDHDPSGIDMTRDIGDRFQVFDVDCQVERIALNMYQVEEFNPPPNPAKFTDSRAAGYVQLYGTYSWELDALEPSMLNQLIRDTLSRFLDLDQYEGAKQDEADKREVLTLMAENFHDVAAWTQQEFGTDG